MDETDGLPWFEWLVKRHLFWISKFVNNWLFGNQKLLCQGTAEFPQQWQLAALQGEIRPTLVILWGPTELENSKGATDQR